MEKLLEVLKLIEPLLIIVIPTVIGIYLKIKSNIDEKIKEQELMDRKRSLEKYDKWEHEESIRIINKIKNLCNYYRDQGEMDLVSYYQMENGTVATSKLCNMFISCLAEDSRYGKLQKQICNLQRIPYSKVSEWIETIKLGAFLSPDVDAISSDSIKETLIEQGANSTIAVDVVDPDGYFLGACVFDYAYVDFNNTNIDEQRKLINEFKVAVQAIFITYHESQLEKKRELNIY